MLGLISWRAWGIVRYNSIVQNIAVFFYVALARRWFALDFVREVGLFLLLSLAGTAFGYLVNDWADLDLDRRAGKPNVFSGMGRGRGALALGALLALVALLGLPFARRPAFLALWGVWVLVTMCYSLPPVRLKERGVLGLAATIAAQQPLPAAMAFAALGYLHTWGAWLFIAYITLRGICSDVGHQMRDRERDAAAGAQTFAVRHGHKAIARLYGLSLELELLWLAAVLVVLWMDIPPVRVGAWNIASALPLIAFYLALAPLTLGRAWIRLERGEWVDPYDESPQGPPRDLLHLMHQPFPVVVVPLYLALGLTVYYWPNVIFVIALVLIYGLYDPRRWARAWPFRSIAA